MAPSSSQHNGYSPNGHAAAPLYPEALPDPSPGPSGMTQLRSLLGLLWEGKWIIVAVFAVVVAAAAAYTYSIPPTYRTSTLLLVNQNEGQSMMPSFTGSRSFLGSQGRNLSNELLVLNNSGAMARRVAARLDTMETNPYTGERLSLLYNSETGERRSLGAIAGRVKGSARAYAAGQEVDAININATSTVPAEAALVANLYARAYIERTREKSRESLQASRDFLERQSEKFRAQVEEAEEALAQYMQNEGAVSLDQESSQIVSQLSGLEARRDELRIELGMAESALQTQQDELRTIRPQLAERLSSSLEQQLARVQQEKADTEAALQNIRRRNPDLETGDASARARDLARLRQRVQALEAEADSLAKQYVEQTLRAGGIGSGGEDGGQGLSYVVELRRNIAQQQIQVNGLKAQINTVEQRIAEYRQRLQDLPPQSLQLAQLQRERRSVERIYGFIREKLQETRMSEESEVGYAEVIRSAGIPGTPVSPDTQKNLTLAALLGLVLGGGLVYLRERLDTHIRAPEDIKALGRRVIGVVPSMESLIETEFNGADQIELEGRSVETALVMLTSPMSAIAEAYRRLRANLRFARPDASIHSLVITSPSQGEGKSTTAANLALAMASAGQKTLLIDADLRRPRLDRYFGMPRSSGLSEALYDGVAPIEAMKTAIDDLYVLSAGEELPNPAEVLGSQRMERFIAEMEDEFDLVIVDTPPVLLFSDPTAVVAHTDGVLLVAAANETDGRAFKHAASLMDDVEAAHIGVVLNRFRADQQRYGYGYGHGSYGYGYGYGSYSEESQLRSYYSSERSPASKGSALSRWWHGG